MNLTLTNRIILIITIALIVWWLSKNIIWILVISGLLWYITEKLQFKKINKVENIIKLVKNLKEDFTLFTAHPNYYTCRKELDNLPRHIRLNKAGGVMYISHNPPVGSNNGKCNIINCPEYLKSPNSQIIDNIPPNLRHRSPDLVKNNNGACWICNNNNNL